MRFHATLLLTAATMAFSAPLKAQAPPAGAVPAHIRQALPEARLSGQGRFTWFGLTIYDAALWVGAHGCRPGSPFVLDLRYARSLNGQRIAKASIEQMQKAGVGSAPQHTQWLINMQAVFPDVHEGTHLSALFTPQAPTRFFLNGQPLGEIGDPEFGPAFAAIWLSPATSAPRLREALLQDAGAR